MRKSFANNYAPMYVGVVREKTPKAAIAAIRNCIYSGATGIDLHLSCLNEDEKTTESIKRIVDSCEKPLLALNYVQNYDWTLQDIGEIERTDLMMKAVDAGASGIDMQGYTFDLESKNEFRKEFKHMEYSFIKDNPKEVVVDPKIIDKQCDLIERVHSKGAEVLLSTHTGTAMTGEQLVELALFLEKRNPDILKIVTTCESDDELIESFRAMTMLKKEVKTKVHYHCGGKRGMLSRIVNPLLGAYLVFCSNGFTESSNVEQPDLASSKAVIEKLKTIVGY